LIDEIKCICPGCMVCPYLVHGLGHGFRHGLGH